jgi:hypothetical protein
MTKQFRTPSTKEEWEQWKHTAEALAKVAPRLAKNLPVLVEWARDVQRGYPERSPGFSDGGGGRGTSDPTASMALSGKDYLKEVDEICRQVDKAFADLLSLDSRTQKLMPDEPVVGRQNTITQCANCKEDCLPRAKAGRCPKCYEFWRRNGRDRNLHKPRRRKK